MCVHAAVEDMKEMISSCDALLFSILSGGKISTYLLMVLLAGGFTRCSHGPLEDLMVKPSLCVLELHRQLVRPFRCSL